MSWKSSLVSFLKTPVFDDRDTALRVETLEMVIVPFLVVTVVFSTTALVVSGRVTPAVVGVIACTLLGLCVLGARKGFVTPASASIVFLLWLFGTLSLYLGGGVTSPGQHTYFVAILMSVVLMDMRASILVALMSLAAAAIITWMESRGALPDPIFRSDPLTHLAFLAAMFASISGLIWIALRQMGKSVDEARRNESLHRLVADSVDDFIFSLSPDMSFAYASPAVERILGFTPEEMLSRKALQEQLVPGSPVISELVARALEEGRDSVRYEAQQYRKDGTPAWCEFSIRLVRNKDGGFERVTGVTRDIGERKAAEAKQFELEAQFRQSQKMEAIGQLAGGIAHDFNNYLTVILGNAEMLAMETSAEKGSPLMEIEDAATRSAELTQQLLAFSRKQVLQPVVLDLNEMIRNADRLLRRVLGEDISIETICAHDLGHVEVDPNQLEQIILNLAVNARAAMPDGGQLSIETGNVYLDARYASNRINVAEGVLRDARRVG